MKIFDVSIPAYLELAKNYHSDFFYAQALQQTLSKKDYLTGLNIAQKWYQITPDSIKEQTASKIPKPFNPYLNLLLLLFKELKSQENDSIEEIGIKKNYLSDLRKIIKQKKLDVPAGVSNVINQDFIESYINSLHQRITATEGKNVQDNEDFLNYSQKVLETWFDKKNTHYFIFLQKRQKLLRLIAGVLHQELHQSNKAKQLLIQYQDFLGLGLIAQEEQKYNELTSAVTQFERLKNIDVNNLGYLQNLTELQVFEYVQLKNTTLLISNGVAKSNQWLLSCLSLFDDSVLMKRYLIVALNSNYLEQQEIKKAVALLEQHETFLKESYDLSILSKSELELLMKEFVTSKKMNQPNNERMSNEFITEATLFIKNKKGREFYDALMTDSLINSSEKKDLYQVLSMLDASKNDELESESNINKTIQRAFVYYQLEQFKRADKITLDLLQVLENKENKNNIPRITALKNLLLYNAIEQAIQEKEMSLQPLLIKRADTFFSAYIDMDFQEQANKSAALLDTLAWYYFMKKDYAKSLYLLEKALKMDPKAEMYYHMIRLHQSWKNNQEKIQYYYQKLQENYPNNIWFLKIK